MGVGCCQVYCVPVGPVLAICHQYPKDATDRQVHRSPETSGVDGVGVEPEDMHSLVEEEGQAPSRNFHRHAVQVAGIELEYTEEVEVEVAGFPVVPAVNCQTVEEDRAGQLVA